MKNLLAFLFTVLLAINVQAQNPEDYYYQIPDYPESYTPGNVAARMMDGLGFRYYWATTGLRDEDLAYKPSEEARTSEETIDHILGLTNVVLNSVKKVPTDFTKPQEELNYDQKRAKTLQNIREASDILKSATEKDFSEFKIIFIGSRGTSEYPFWNQLNGPIADALWHVGQVVSFRRSSGNPFTSEVSVLRGRVRE